MLSIRNFLKRHSSDPVRRRRALNKYFARRLHRHDLHLYKAHLNWALSEELRALHREWGETPGVPPDRCYFLHAMARTIADAGVPGDTAECGVRFGKSTFFLMKALTDSARPHHVFDSFAGLSEAGPADRPVSGIEPWAQGELSVAEHRTREHLADFPNCSFYRGWIPERFDEVADRRFALVHIDVDLFEPTRDALAFFHPRMHSGGVIICDDYGFATCPGAKAAFDEYFTDRPEYVVPIPSGQCFVQIP